MDPVLFTEIILYSCDYPRNEILRMRRGHLYTFFVDRVWFLVCFLPDL